VIDGVHILFHFNIVLTKKKPVGSSPLQQSPAFFQRLSQHSTLLNLYINYINNPIKQSPYKAHSPAGSQE
jgi:hypothetical protein